MDVPKSTTCVIREPRPIDAPAVIAIDGAGLATGHASFREEPYTWDRWQDTYASGLLRVAESDGDVLGWAGVSAMSNRCVYHGLGEISVYIDPMQRGRGVGRQLLQGTIDAAESSGYWTLVAQIFPANTASISLHRRCGFRVVGVRERLGRMNYGPFAGRWRDIVFMERRSAVAGRD